MTNALKIELSHIESGPALHDIRTLFVEYAEALNVDLCFQRFETELQQLPGQYAKPQGRLILCRADETPAGCIALKPLSPGICEMKRLYVRPEFRRQKLGLKLTKYLIEEARREGYRSMRLDTIPGALDPAIALYRSLGFTEIPPYYDSPIANALYMELRLARISHHF